jgi:SHS2 domain-containing protein
MEYRYLGHTSEAKFQAFGQTLEECFINAGLALENLMVDIRNVHRAENVQIELETNSLEKLLYDFLDELLYLKDAEGLFVAQFMTLDIIQRQGTYTLRATALGDTIKKYNTKADVKAPTYHDMNIQKVDHEWMIQVVVDV